jgi:hypothetical protein
MELKDGLDITIREILLSIVVVMPFADKKFAMGSRLPSPKAKIPLHQTAQIWLNSKAYPGSV